MPEFNLIKGSKNKIIGAASKILPAKIRIIPKKIENITTNNLIAFEIFCVLPFANADKINTKIIKIIIPKNSKFIY